MVESLYPSGSDYVEALQNPSVCFRDKKLKDVQVRLDKLGRPRPISGNFASVFAVTTPPDGKKLAIKCFTRHISDQEARYRAVSDHLATIEASWKVSFEYSAESILVQGRWYPTLQMDWADGTNLISWIDRNVSDPHRVAQLANNFVELVSSLEMHGVAHGDLQHGNLLVADDSSLRLVDYDGMFVPALANLHAAEQGHRNYQAPTRSSEFHPRVDRFSAWVIYLSLAAIVKQPSLWTQLRSPDGEYLLLSEDDFHNPAGSARFPSLLNHGSPAVRDLSQQVLTFTQLSTDSVPQLDAIDLESSVHGTKSVYPGPAKPHGGGPPNWMLSHLQSKAAPEKVRFSNRTRSSALTSFSLPAGIGLLVLARLLGLLSFLLAVEAAALLILIWSISVYVEYRRRPERLARRAALARRAEARKRENRASRFARETKKKLEDFEKEELRREERMRRDRDAAQQLHKQRAEEADRDLQKKISQLAKESASIFRQRQVELDQALREAQEAYIVGRLRAARLTDARLPGIGPKIVTNLQAYGISTAADFVGIRHMQSGQKSLPLLVLRSGQEVKVPNIGEVKARTLESWRHSISEAAKRGMPSALLGDTRTAILGRYSAKERQVANSHDQAQRDMQSAKAKVAQQLSAKLVEIAERQKRENLAASRTRADLERARASRQTELEMVRPDLSEVEAEVRSYCEIGFLRFVAFGFLG